MDCRAEGHGTQLPGRQRLRPCRVRWPCWAAKRVAARKLRDKRQFHSTLLPHSDNMGSAWHTREEKGKKEWVLYASAIVALLLLGAIAAIVVVATGAAKKGGGGSSSGSAAVDAAAPVAARSPPPPARQVAEQSTPAAKPPPPASLSQASKPPPSPPTSRPPPPSPTAKPPPPPRPSPPPVVRPPPPPPTTFDPSFTAPGTTNNVPPAPGQVQAPRCCPVQLAGRTQCPLASTIHPAPPPCSLDHRPAGFNPVVVNASFEGTCELRTDKNWLCSGASLDLSRCVCCAGSTPLAASRAATSAHIASPVPARRRHDWSGGCHRRQPSEIDARPHTDGGLRLCRHAANRQLPGEGPNMTCHIRTSF